MIRVRPIIPKPIKRTSQPKKPKGADEQNQKPVSFNTKGYFDPTNCSDEDYLNEKQRVFEKYRNRRNEIVMLDIKNTNKSLLIHRGLLRPTYSQQEFPSEKTKNLLKSYLIRKEKHLNNEQEKYLEVPKISIDTLTHTCNTASSRTSNSRQVTSRISTATVLKIESEF